MPPKNNGFNVLSKNEARSIRFFNYLYKMIKEAAPALLERDDVQKAYNKIVECCLKHNRHIVSYIPTVHNKYRNVNIIMPYDYPKISRSDDNSDKGSDVRDDNSDNMSDTFVLDEDASVIHDSNIPIYFLFEFDTAEDTKLAMSIRHDITKNYIPLYELIKREVIPYMDRKEWEREKKRVIPYLNKKIETYSNRIRVLENEIVVATDMIQLTIQQIKLYDEPIITKFRD